jgi:hypothetical protein
MKISRSQITLRIISVERQLDLPCRMKLSISAIYLFVMFSRASILMTQNITKLSNIYDTSQGAG